MRNRKPIVALVSLALLIFTGSGLAKKPESPGNSGKAGKPAHAQNADANHDAKHAVSYFSGQRIETIHSYYSSRKSDKGCPPGLQKKNNGCRPPGQTKGWSRGAPLPPDIVYHDVPHDLLHAIGRTPEGQKIVRVGTDLLLISIGTGMVIDALEDLDDIF